MLVDTVWEPFQEQLIENIREIIFGSYRIVYVVSEDEVNILTVFHAARLLRPSDLPGGASE